VIARVPLDEGSLAGAMTLDTRFPDSDWRSRYFGPENLPETISHVEALKAELPAGMTLAELAIRFVLSDARVSTTIVGVRSAAHLRENLAAAHAGALPEDVLSKLRHHRWDRVPAAWSD
jgi:aryl-alcohol dehydrogenase-like predicted oxidoreductase